MALKFGFLILITIGIGYLYNEYNDMTRPLEAPKFDLDEYWGPGNKSDYIEDKEPRQQKVLYPRDAIDKLKARLNESLDLHSPLEGVGFEYGVNSEKLAEIVEYWRDDYLPRWYYDREHFLNTLPHFLMNIQGLDIHYIHTKAVYKTYGKKVVPLLLLHGWPGSVREFFEIIPKLALPTDDTNVVFEVVAPSLPGFAWSDGAAKPGFGIAEMSVVLRNLMIQLGYERFYVQGGDWGFFVGSTIATLFPENVIGFHSNTCIGQMNIVKELIASYFPASFVPEGFEDFYFPLADKYSNFILETGYFHIQATKPDTIGIALSTNPVGLAAYLLEKFSTWTDPSFRALPDGGLRNELLDPILDNIMIYYLTNSITTSVRLYAETFTQKQLAYKLDRVPTVVPTGCAKFKNDLGSTLDWILEDKFKNLVHRTYHRQGGHFAALEVADVLYNDFIEFVKIVQKLERKKKRRNE